MGRLFTMAALLAAGLLAAPVQAAETKPDTAKKAAETKGEAKAGAKSDGGTKRRKFEMTEDQRESLEAFVLGNTLFVVFHEIGHALVDQFNLPVLGREEDAVDSLAAILMLPEDEEGEGDPLIANAVLGWAFTLSDETPTAEAYMDEHSLDQQRFYQIFCLVYGSSPKGYADLAEYLEMPKDKLKRCPSQYAQTYDNWWKALGPDVAGKGFKPKHKVKVSYGSAKGDARDAGKIVREAKLFESVAESLTETFRLRRPITIRFEKCGIANAFYRPEEGDVTICWELVDSYHDGMVGAYKAIHREEQKALKAEERKKAKALKAEQGKS